MAKKRTFYDLVHFQAGGLPLLCAWIQHGRKRPANCPGLFERTIHGHEAIQAALQHIDIYRNFVDQDGRIDRVVGFVSWTADRVLVLDNDYEEGPNIIAVSRNPPEAG